MIYIAVVTRLWNRPKNATGSWASFVDKSKEAAIRKATEAKDKWEKGGDGPYEILVGTLTEEWVPPQFVGGHAQEIPARLAGERGPVDGVCCNCGGPVHFKWEPLVPRSMWHHAICPRERPRRHPVLRDDSYWRGHSGSDL